MVALSTFFLACGGQLEQPPPSDCDCPGAQVCSQAGVCIDPGTCAADGDCPPGETCDLLTASCVVASACGGQSLATKLPSPNLLVLLDRSCSMAHKVAGRSKWRTSVDALGWMLHAHHGAIRFGLSMFPDKDRGKCAQGAIAVPPAADREDQIGGLLQAALAKESPNYPSGPCVTNIDTAVKQATKAAALKDADRESFVLLITDGYQYGCEAAGGDAGTKKLIKELASRGVKTFVLGFGNKVDPDQLEIFAKAGGVPAAGTERKFYRADDQSSLEQALAKIASRSKGHCHHQLDQLPADLDQVRVHFDGNEIGRDPTRQDGWELDPNSGQLTFHGTACAELEANRVDEVKVDFSCLRRSDGGAMGRCAAELQCSAATHCSAGYSCLQGCCVPPVQ